MTIENSPRATRAVPARSRPAGPTPARAAATQPVYTLVAPVTIASRMAGTATATRSPGMIWNEKNRKNVAANRSRSGPMRAWARSCTGPDRAMPTRKAPMAAETCSRWATPPTSRVSPKTDSSRASSVPLASTSLSRPPHRSATVRIAATAVNATATVTTVVSASLPASRAATTGR